jgi:hypothetical protein
MRLTEISLPTVLTWSRRALIFLLAVAALALGAYVSAVALWLNHATISQLTYYALYPYQGYRDQDPLMIPLKDKVAVWVLEKKTPEEINEEATATGTALETVFGARMRDEKSKRLANLHAARVADLLLAKGIDLDERDSYGCTAVQRAMLNGDREAVCYFLSRGAIAAGHPRARIGQCRESIDERAQRLGAANACDMCRQVLRPATPAQMQGL